jgi:hypothetical protein
MSDEIGHNLLAALAADIRAPTQHSCHHTQSSVVGHRPPFSSSSTRRMSGGWPVRLVGAPRVGGRDAMGA